MTMKKLTYCLLFLLTSCTHSSNAKQDEVIPSSHFNAKNQCIHNKPANKVKPRTVVMTDGEIDDTRSMVRFLYYSSEFTTEAIIQTNSYFQKQGHNSATKEYWLEEQIEAYKNIRETLSIHKSGFPDADQLLKRIYVGDIEPNHLKRYPPFSSTPGSDKIIELLLDENPQEIWFQAWGGLNTMAQALYEIKNSGKYSTEQWNYAASKTKIYSIFKQDYGFDYIQKKFPDVLIIYTNAFWDTYGYTSRESIHYNPYMNERWVRMHISHHGMLADRFNGKKIQEGDTPAFLNLIDNGLNAYLNPTFGGWGGRFKQPSKNSRYFDDSLDNENLHYSIDRFIPASQNDYQARLDWGNTSNFDKANHPPCAKTNQKELINAKAGEVITINNISLDPDNDSMQARWWQYYEADSILENVSLSQTSSTLTFRVPNTAKIGDTIHLILEVTDNGTPNLTSYKRTIVSVTR